MAKFVQIIEFSTSRIDEVQAAGDEWREATKGQTTASWEIVAADRDQPNRYMLIVSFPSYDDAQKNNELPATATVAEKMAKLCDGEPIFRNLDVMSEESF